MAEKLQRRALEVVQGGEARPEVVSEVASSLADMLYAQEKHEEAQEAVETAMASAEAGGNNALYIKLSNNLGAVLRKLNKHAEVCVCVAGCGGGGRARVVRAIVM